MARERAQPGSGTDVARALSPASGSLGFDRADMSENPGTKWEDGLPCGLPCPGPEAEKLTWELREAAPGALLILEKR